jgi:hypothetical protein
MSEACLVTLSASPALEEALVDWLMSQEAVHGFSSFPLSDQASRSDGLSLAEQVRGVRKRIGFQVCVKETELAAFLEQLRQDFKGSGIRFWVLPVVDAGQI